MIQALPIGSTCRGDLVSLKTFDLFIETRIHGAARIFALHALLSRVSPVRSEIQPATSSSTHATTFGDIR